MEKSSEKHIADGLVEESKIDPVYQGGYTDGYEAGEQYGHIASWNEAIEAVAELAEPVILRNLGQTWIQTLQELLAAIRKLKKP